MNATSAVEIEQATWASFAAYGTDFDFIDSWLALQCQMIAGVRCGWLFARDDDGAFNLIASFSQVAQHEPSDELKALLAETVEAVIETERGVAEPIDDDVIEPSGFQQQSANNQENCWLVALPMMADGGTVAISVVAIFHADKTGVASAMRQLKWGSGWVLDWLRRQGLRGDQVEAVETDNNGTSAGDEAVGMHVGPPGMRLVASVLETARFKDAAAALATQLSEHFDLERASVGVRENARTRVVAMSHSSYTRDRMDEVRRVEAAMDEALDQRASIFIPTDQGVASLIVRSHQALSEANATHGTASIPIHGPGGGLGAITLERSTPFTNDERAAMEAMSRLGGVALLEKRIHDRPLVSKIKGGLKSSLTRFLGPSQPFTKIGLGIVATVLLASWLITSTFEVRTPVRVEADELRIISAPFDGYLRKSFALAGDAVDEGEVLAKFDVADLLLEQTSLSAERNELLVQFEEANAAYKQSEAQVFKARAEKIEAQLALVRARLSRADVTAPFAGLIVAGDLTQSIGEPMKTGQELYKIAPQGKFRLVALVDERDIYYVKPGQTGRFTLVARPEEQHSLKVDRVTPVLEATDGRNFYRVEASINTSSESFRPGLEGRGRIEVGEASTLWIMTRDILGWIKLQTWALMPL